MSHNHYVEITSPTEMKTSTLKLFDRENSFQLIALLSVIISQIKILLLLINNTSIIVNDIEFMIIVNGIFIFFSIFFLSSSFSCSSSSSHAFFLFMIMIMIIFFFWLFFYLSEHNQTCHTAHQFYIFLKSITRNVNQWF